ncbi:MAG: UDP-N-acetylmuramoylalanine--D-glutamate ligase [Planctomycetes bacterium RBG_16_55_9]|nr:MAG: UDP-N-acetylmuramoylalanine--D-glutamate ligase [Planctomycetes bacterium RBG_16_55_9]
MRGSVYNFANKKVLVMGLGRFGGGVDVVTFAHAAGAKVVVTDLAQAEQLSASVSRLGNLEGIEFHLGSHDPADFGQADIVVANPAVPDDNEFLQIARRAGKLVTSQMNIFFELCPATIIGITGANGKSTTTALTAHLLRNTKDEGRWTRDEPQATSDEPVIASEAKQSQPTQYAIRNTHYENVWLSGNIGNQPLLTTVDQMSPDDLVVLELSSFQLEQLAQIQRAPKVALLTNLTPNHLDRHGTFANYCAAKENIFKFQTLDEDSPAISIFNAEDEVASAWFEKYKNDPGRICIKFCAGDVSEELRSVFSLPGRANLSNLAAAMAIARHFGVDENQIRNSLPEFKALPHRLEFVERIDGVSWYNDSKATTPQGAITALEAFEQPIIIIAGGYDKNLPFDELGEKIFQRAKSAILIGQTAPKIADAIQLAELRVTSHKPRVTISQIVGSLAEAVLLAHALAVAGDVVLLSPACASYDMFDNYEHRGREFINLVRAFSTKKAGVQTT